MAYASLSQPQLLPPAVFPRPHNGAGLELTYGDIRFREGVLGQGCFGAVYPASLPHTGPVAVKILKCGPRQRQSYQREVAALKRALEECSVAHPQLPPPIVRLRGYCAEPHACIVTELCEGTTGLVCASHLLSKKTRLMNFLVCFLYQEEASSQ
jgi:hypothetical protein